MSALAWWLIPLVATVLAVLFVMLRSRPAKPTTAEDAMAHSIAEIAAALGAQAVGDLGLVERQPGQFDVVRVVLDQQDVLMHAPRPVPARAPAGRP